MPKKPKQNFLKKGATDKQQKQQKAWETKQDQTKQDGADSFFPWTSRDWNNLPENIVSAASVDAFKQLLQDHQ